MDKCVKCKKEFSMSDWKKTYWTEKDDVRPHRIGKFKEYVYECECGFKNQMIPM